MLAPTATTPVCPTPAEEIAEALDSVGPLHGLAFFEDRLWLARHGEEVVAQPGNVLFEEGSPADRMILLLKGEIHVRVNKAVQWRCLLAAQAQMTGVLPFSRMKSRRPGVRNLRSLGLAHTQVTVFLNAPGHPHHDAAGRIHAA